ncbi:MAG: DUF4145 domain-containing protein [Bacillus sp. (in: Bacteria)]|nr:DUF4145 domain-containing protein [Bacillus sp. (in: firmicutes)]
METKRIKYHNGSYSSLEHISIEIPFLCPHCDVSNNPENNFKFIQKYNDTDGSFLGLIHKCTACEKLFFTLHLVKGKTSNLICQYPNTKNRTFPQLLCEMSPRFVEMYNHSQTAEQLNHIDLAGMGYRASLEILIKDFALYFEKDSKETIADLSLNNAIGKYFKSDEGIVSADVVRKLGNDYAHWEKEYEQFNIDVLKGYLEIFITQIHLKLMVKHPPIPTRTPI